MTTITFSYKDIRSYGIEKQLLEQLIPRIGMEVEKSSDDEITIDITPNRPDLLDFTNLTRALLQFAAKKKPSKNFYSAKGDSGINVTVKQNVNSIRPFICALVVKNANLTGNRLAYLINFTEKFCDTFGRQRRKVAIGIHDLSKINGNITYDAAADGNIIALGSKSTTTFRQVITDHDKAKLYAKISIGKDNKICYLSDQKKTIALVPIINSELTRVTASTKDLFIDITGTSENAVTQAADMLACSFIDSGAHVLTCNIISDATKKVPKLQYKHIRLKLNDVENTLGLHIKQSQVIDLLAKMGHGAKEQDGYIMVDAPPYRTDIIDEQDIIDDIAIAYGYDKMVPEPIASFSVGSQSDQTNYINELSRLMIGIGYTEVMNTYLTNELVNYANMLEKEKSGEALKVEHSKTENITMLRTSILPQLLSNLGLSSDEKTPLRAFEIGKVFFSADKGKIIQHTNIALATEHSKADFSEIKSNVEAIMQHISNSYSLMPLKSSFLIEGRAAAIKVGNKVVGYLGEVHPAVLENFGIIEPTVAAEINILEESF